MVEIKESAWSLKFEMPKMNYNFFNKIKSLLLANREGF